MRIVAIDLAYAHPIGMAIFDLLKNTEWSAPLEAPKKTLPIWERQAAVYKTVMSKLHPDDLVFIEDYAFAAHSASDTRLKELGGILRHMIWRKTGIFPVEVNIGILKKFTTGKGNGRKDLILKAVYKLWGTDFDDDNEADAYALSRLGRAWIMKEDILAYQKAAILKLRSSLSANHLQQIVHWKHRLKLKISES